MQIILFEDEFVPRLYPIIGRAIEWAKEIAAAEFIQQMPQAVGRAGLGPHGLLQAFADSVADRPGGLVINRLGVVV
jgi:hypothetical protein